MRELFIVMVLIPSLSILLAASKSAVIAHIEQSHQRSVNESNRIEMELFQDRLKEMECHREDSRVVGF
jgi:hypothetical protein